VLQCRIRHHAIDEHSSIRGRAINDWQSHELMLAEGGGGSSGFHGGGAESAASGEVSPMRRRLGFQLLTR
jgi:hypothetical protein